MGIFDKLLSKTSTFTYSPKSEEEAWMAVLYACIAVDGDVSDAEIDKLCQLLVFKKMFNDKQLVDYYKPSQLAFLQIGSKGLIDNSAAKILESNRPTVFALAMELLLADGILGEKEKEILEYLTAALNLPIELAEKIVEVLLIKNKDNVIVID